VALVAAGGLIGVVRMQPRPFAEWTEFCDGSTFRVALTIHPDVVQSDCAGLIALVAWVHGSCARGEDQRPRVLVSRPEVGCHFAGSDREKVAIVDALNRNGRFDDDGLPFFVVAVTAQR
jgi:hypothetical protein